MAWIHTISIEEATGRLRRLYDQAIQRAGKVFQVVQVQGLRPNTLAASTRLYTEIMHAPDSKLSRIQREMIATAVSRANACHY